MSKSYIKCSECNTVNLDNDYCSNCGALLDVVLKRKLEREKKAQHQKEEKPSQISEFLRKGTTHPNSIIRILFQIFNSIWLFFAMVFGGIIAAIIAAAAG
ncbi:hypothetical protein AAGV33_01965 [Flavobacterium sp. FBOR7N2.3]|uniref:Zinc ribbon domain-containing protein n=1 Tax=Flavobacterium magnesitis TaxID=3138077 RepID=A0ABV4TGQ7_9FLAO